MSLAENTDIEAKKSETKNEDKESIWILARNYLAILLALIVLVVSITTLLFFYNPILDSVFTGHKALQSDGNLINFFEKTFGLAVTILVSSVALVIALLSVKILKTQTKLLEKQNEISSLQADLTKQQNNIAQKQFDFELKSHVNRYFEDYFKNTVEVYNTINKIFLNCSLIEKFHHGSGTFIDNEQKYKIDEYDDMNEEYSPGSTILGTDLYKDHLKYYSDHLKPIYAEIRADANRLMNLITLRGSDLDFDQILSFSTSSELKNLKEYYACLDELNSNSDHRNPIIFQPSNEQDEQDHYTDSIFRFNVNNIAINISLDKSLNIVDAIGNLSENFNLSQYRNDDEYRYIYFQFLLHIMIAAIILHSPKRIFLNLDKDPKIDDEIIEMLNSDLKKRMLSYESLFYINGDEIYPNYGDHIKRALPIT